MNGSRSHLKGRVLRQLGWKFARVPNISNGVVAPVQQFAEEADSCRTSGTKDKYGVVRRHCVLVCWVYLNLPCCMPRIQGKAEVTIAIK